MKFRKSLLVALCVASMGGLLAPTTASAAVAVYLNVAPPPPRYEAVPAARKGYVWAPGYWNYRGHRHVWVRGHWVRARHGYHWVPGHWDERGNHRWHFTAGRWDRD